MAASNELSIASGWIAKKERPIQNYTIAKVQKNLECQSTLSFKTPQKEHIYFCVMATGTLSATQYYILCYGKR